MVTEPLDRSHGLSYALNVVMGLVIWVAAGLTMIPWFAALALIPAVVTTWLGPRLSSLVRRRSTGDAVAIGVAIQRDDEVPPEGR